MIRPARDVLDGSDHKCLGLRLLALTLLFREARERLKKMEKEMEREERYYDSESSPPFRRL